VNVSFKIINQGVYMGAIGVARGPFPLKLLGNIVILCFERRFSKRNCDIRLKSNILPPQKISGLAASLLLAGCFSDTLLQILFLPTYTRTMDMIEHLQGLQTH